MNELEGPYDKKGQDESQESIEYADEWHESVRKIFEGFFITISVLALFYFLCVIATGQWYPWQK